MFNSGFRGRRAPDNAGTISPEIKFVQTKYPVPAITGWSISGSDDTALNPAGGQTVLVNGSGFAVGCAATLNGVTISPVTLVSPTQISFTAPANSGGSYTLIVYNSNGGAAILVPGLTYSTVPTWTTAAGSIGSYYETTAINSNVVATSDSALTYSLSSGSLPSGATLYANGVITGTAPVDSSSTTYTFAITATDAELQDTTRTFTMTINVDVVTWVTPSSGATITTSGAVSQSLSATDAAGYGVVYTANALPTGLSLSGNTISGTANVTGTSYTLLTATANTTGRTSTNTITWIVSLGDSYFMYDSMLLSANASITTSSFVNDNSLNNAQIVVNGDTRAQNVNPYQPGYYSTYFDGSASYLYNTTTSSSMFDLSTGNWTVEAWVYPLSGGINASILSLCNAAGNNSGLSMFINTSNQFGCDNGVSATTPGGNVPANTWTHVAAVRSSGSTTFYVNGVSVSSGISQAPNTAQYFFIGRASNTGTPQYFNGYISNLRVVKGTALYTSAFTPSTTPLSPASGTSLLTCQSNRFVDNSPNNFTVTKNSDTTLIKTASPFGTAYQAGTQYYSTYFDGTGDYLSWAASGAFAQDTFFGTGKTFTIEAWLYQPTYLTNSSYWNIVLGDASGSSGTNMNWSVGTNYQNKPVVTWWDGSNSQSAIGATALTTYTWNHVAWVSTAGTVTIYVNGVSQTLSGTTTLTNANRSTGMVVGVDRAQYYTGQISNLRAVAGQALYTTTFTPSTSPLTTTSQGATASNVKVLTCQSSTIIDNSPSALSITANGDVKPIVGSPFTPSAYSSTAITTYGSGYFDGTGDYLSLAAPQPSLDLTSTDFTLECWVYNAGAGAERYLFSQRGSGSGWEFRINATNLCQFFYTSGSSLTSTGTITGSTWTHLAVTRSGTTVRIFINGALDSSATFSNGTSAAGSYGLYIGYGTTGGGYMLGYITDARIVKGTAVYTSAFVPPAAPLTAVTNTQLLTLQTNGAHNDSTFSDNSSFNTLITRAGDTTNGTFSPYGNNFSNYFNGSTDYLTCTEPAGTTGDFTYEMWLYPGAAFSALQIPFCNANGTTGAFAIEITAIGKLSIYIGNFSTPVLTTTSGMTATSWNHIAVVRTGTTVYVYINGTRDATSYSTSAIVGQGGTYYIGRYAGAVEYYNGYISNLRVVVGTAVYTGASVTVPTSPLTAIANTKLLTCQSNRFIDVSAANTALTRNGSVTVQKFSPFRTVTLPTYYSTYFDGNLDYLNAGTNSAYNLGAGDFTIEAWVYITARGSSGSCFAGTWAASGRSWIFLCTSTTISFVYSTNGTDATSAPAATYTVPLTTWTHVAAVRYGNTITIYVNGTSVGTASVTGVTIANTAQPLYIGANKEDVDSGINNYQMNGYISNFRLVKGTAVYTANFTPSTSPLTAISGTSLLACQSNTIIDNSTNNFSVTVGGDSKPLAVSPFTPTASSPTAYSTATFGGSMYFDGTGDYLTLNSANLADFGTGDFTMECWFYAAAVAASYQGLFESRPDATNGAYVTFLLNTNHVSLFTQSAVQLTGTITAGTWVHAAIVRLSGTSKIYVNGVQAGSSYADTNSYLSRPTPLIGYLNGSSNPFTGYISDFRITKGKALYTANFYPGAAPATPTYTIGTTTYTSNLLLNGTAGGVIDATRTVDLETLGDAKAVQNGPYGGSYYSNYFDGTGDYLTVPDSATLELGSSNFTIEMWVYVNAAAQATLLCHRATNVTNGPLALFKDSSNVIKMYLGTGASGWDILNGPSIGTVSTGQWYHVSVCRSGSTFYGSLAGTVSSIGTSASTIGDVSASWGIGGDIDGNNSLNGYISNLRIVKGQALYTSNFTPSTSPLTTTSQSVTASNVGLLTCQSNKFMDNSTNAFTVTANGNAATQPQNPFQVNTGTSYYFDGTGDYLTAASNPALNFGTGDFTVECWVYFNSFSGSPFIFNKVTANSGWFVEVSASILYFGYGLASAGQYWQASVSLITGVWYNIAVTRSGAVLSAYVNGTKQSTTLSGAASSYDNTAPFTIGSYNSSYYLNGYISDFRVTTGYLRYSATFTPPTAPLSTS